MNSPFAVFMPSARAPALIPFAIAAMMVGDGEASSGILLDQALRRGLSLVGRIIEHLNIEFVQADTAGGKPRPAAAQPQIAR